MKTKLKILMLVLFALVVVSAVNIENRLPHLQQVKNCYTEFDIHALMQFNGWSREAAVEILTLSCEHAVVAK